jgi:hypothetical protein
VPKVSVVVFKGSEPSNRALWKCNGHVKEGAPKKKIQGFPPVFTLENFKNSLCGRHEAVIESPLASLSSSSSSSSSSL